MARRTHRQVDPFNAGDPIMPSDELGQEYVPISPEGEWVSPEGQGSADGHGCWVDDAPKAPRKPGQGSAGSRSGKQRQSKARTSTAKASKPASRAASAARPKGSRQSTAQSAGRTMGRTFRKSFVVLIAIALVVEMGGALTSCADTLFDGLEDAGYGVTHAVSAISAGRAPLQQAAPSALRTTNPPAQKASTSTPTRRCAMSSRARSLEPCDSSWGGFLPVTPAWSRRSPRISTTRFSRTPPI